jgi:hypothetical protein
VNLLDLIDNYLFNKNGRKEFQLQKSALPIHFDEKSTKNDVRGCIQSAYSCILLYSLPFLSLTYFY